MFELVSGNLCGVSPQHMWRLKCRIHARPLINLDSNDTNECLSSYIPKIQEKRGDKIRAVFTVGLDGTVLVKTIKFGTMMVWWLEALI